MLQRQASSSVEVHSLVIARISGVQNTGQLEFPPVFKNEMFVADVIWQRQKEEKKPENPNV